MRHPPSSAHIANRPRLACAAVALCLGGVARADVPDALSGAGGTLRLPRPDCLIGPRLATPAWSFRESREDGARTADGAYPFRLEAAPDLVVRGTAAFAATPDGAIAATYRFAPDRDVTLNALFVGTSLPSAVLAGGAWTADNGRGGAIPVVPGDATIFAGPTHSLALTTVGGQRLTFNFTEPTAVLLQDDRQWGPTFSVRIGHGGGVRTFRAGELFAVRFTVATREPLKLVADAPVTLAAGSDWVPFTAAADILPGSALDFSALGLADAPAGKHGRVLARGPHFEFARLPGVRQRFYGVNLCFGANFLPPADAAKLAARLARIGYNALRLHHHDGGLVAGSADGTTPNPAALAKLDALVAACIARGIYLTTDLYVSRPVPWRSVGIDRDGAIPMNTFKMLVPVHDGALENLKSFTRQWLGHVNPHTGRSLAQEPAMAWLCLINEGNYGNFRREMGEIPEWQAAWRDWLTARRARAPATVAGVPDTLPDNLFARKRHAGAFALFLADIETRFVTRMRSFLRDELGSHALLSNQNAWTYFVSDQVVRHMHYDYADDHFYVDHPHFLERPWSLPSRCDNRNPIRNEALGVSGVVFTRLLDKPFTITEYNYSGPGRFRGVGGMVTGTLAALQDWSGLWRFAFSHSADGIASRTAPRLNYFDMAHDPLALASERVAICLFLRGDLAPLERSYALAIPEGTAAHIRDEGMPSNRAPWAWLAWYARLGTRVVPDGAAAAAGRATWVGRFPESYAATTPDIRALLQPDPSAPLPAAGDGAVRLDAESGTFVIRTPRTSGGFTEAGSVDAGALLFDVGDVAATVWVSALDAAPIARSARLLLTHLTDVQNTGIRYADRGRQTLLDWGALPHLARNGRAVVRLALDDPAAYAVHALAASGERLAAIPARVEDGRLVFTAAIDAVPATATLLYEIVRNADDGKR